MYRSKYHPSNPNEGKESLDFYKELGYGDINTFLRLHSLPDKVPSSTIMQIENTNLIPLMNHVSNIDKELYSNETPANRMTIPNGTVLYRGLNMIMDGLYKTSIIVNKGFSSCTTDLNVTRSFVNTTEPVGDYCCIVAFTLPSDIKYYVYPDDDKKDREREVLLERNTQFSMFEKITDYRVHGYEYYSCILSKYTPPVITKEEIRKRDEIKKTNDLLRQQAIKNQQDLKDWSSSDDDVSGQS